MNKPEDLDPNTDVAVEHVTRGATVHKPGDIVTGCGQPMWAMQRPFTSAGHMAALCGDFCDKCWPRENAWERMLSAACDTTRWAERLLASPDTFPTLNPSARLRASSFAERNHR